MQVDRNFAAHQPCIALCIAVGFVSVGNNAGQFLNENIVVDEVGEERNLCIDNRRREVPSRVYLPAELGFQLVVTQFVGCCALVYAVRAKLSKVRSAETTR